MTISTSKPSSRSSRLTFGPGASRNRLPTTADIPSFSHRSSQSDSRQLKPLPKPVKEGRHQQPEAKAKTPRREPTWRTRKRLEKEEAERKKREEPLDEAEEGEYDAYGIWRASQTEPEWCMDGAGVGAPQNEKDAGVASQVEDDNVGCSSLEGLQRRDDPDQPEHNIARELLRLHDLGLEDNDRNRYESVQAPSVRHPPANPNPTTGDVNRNLGLSQMVKGPISDLRGRRDARADRSGPARVARSDPSPGRGLQKPLPGPRGASENENSTVYTGIHRRSPDIPMPPSAQRQRSISLPAPAQHSRLKYSALGTDDTDTDTDTDDDDDEDSLSHMSPTELNSSAIHGPVQRPETRRSNSHRQVYSMQTQELDGDASSPQASQSVTNGQRDPDFVAEDQTGNGHPSSFAVSQTEVPSEGSVELNAEQGAQAAPVQTIATYSRSRPRISKSSRLSRRDRAHETAFRELFSPELEWEADQRRKRRELERARSKRHGSTSLWPAWDQEQTSEVSTASTIYVDDGPRRVARDQDRETSGENDEDEDGLEGLFERLPLGEVRVNALGRVVARGRGRNGAWPEDRQSGLFGEGDSQDERRGDTQALRPASDRLHIIKQDEQGEDRKHLRKSSREKIRAFPDLYQKHPIAKLKLRSDSARSTDFDDAGRRLNVNDRYDRLPYMPSVNAFPKSSRKRKNELNDLPDYVLKPIQRVPLAEYKKQLRERVAGDGFLNPIFVKSGRLASRNHLLKPQKRIKRSQSAGRNNIAFEAQTQIGGDDGEPDPIVPPTQTQRAASNGTIGYGLRVRRERNRRPTTRAARGQQLPFTSASPPLEDDSGQSRAGILPFTSRAPPARFIPLVTPLSTSHDDPEDTVRSPRPAEQVPGLIQPRVGFANRFKRKRSLPQDHIESPDKEEQERTVKPKNQRGYARKVAGYWAPPTTDQGDWVLNGSSPSPPTADDIQESALFLPSDTQFEGPLTERGEEVKQQRAPLSLPHDDDVGTSPTHQPTVQDTTPTGDQPSNRMSGAQLCHDLLHRVAHRDTPIVPLARSTRGARRHEMAKRVAQKTTHGPVESGPSHGFTTQAMVETPAKEDDEIVYEPDPSQIRRREEFESLLAAGGAVNRSESRSKAASESTRNGVTSTQLTEAQDARFAVATESTGQSSARGPPGNQEALIPQKSVKPPGKAGWTRSGFQAPRPVKNTDTSRPRSLVPRKSARLLLS